jgi:hypothetical protein
MAFRDEFLPFALNKFLNVPELIVFVASRLDPCGEVRGGCMGA